MQPLKSEIVITGLGACCHFGDDLDLISKDLRSGKNTAFQTYNDSVRYGGRCQIIGLYEGSLANDVLDITKQESRFMGRAAKLALKATRKALLQSKLNPGPAALVVGSGTGDVATHREVMETLNESGMRRTSATVIPKLMASTVSANLSSILRTKGPSFTVSAACAGGAYNILLAASLIESGIVDCAIAGGVEIADPHFFAGFDSMRAYNSKNNDDPITASRPYSANRAGFIFSEGAGIVVLEKRETAEQRGVPIQGVLKGYGMSSDGSGEMVAPSWEGALSSMENALTHAAVSHEKIDYVNTHGTSTPLGDLSEIRAMRTLFNERLVHYSSTKGYTGHPVSAAGAIEAIFTILMLRGDWIAPSINATPLDPTLKDYPPTIQPTRKELHTALSNSFGFGGTNVTLVLGAP